jgi:hypothetical protein
MAPTLTLHQGEKTREFIEHPTETARKALLAAADYETGRWPELLRRVASELPSRESIMATKGGE